MNINKYFLSLDKEKQDGVLEIVNINKRKGWSKQNATNTISHLLFPERIDFIWIEPKYEAISDLIYDYADRLLIYKTEGYSFGQYLRDLDKNAKPCHDIIKTYTKE